MISYIDEFEELIVGMDSGQGYIQNFVDGLSDLRIKNIILVRWNEGSIRTISEAFDLAMEKETSYSNLAGSGDELLLMTSSGASDAIVQRISTAVCENMKKGHEGEYDLSCGFDSIPTNFLKNRQYGSQGNFPPSNNARSNNDTSSGNNKRFIDDFPPGTNTRFNNNWPPGSDTRFHNDTPGYGPHTESNRGPFGGERRNDSYNGGQYRPFPWRGRRCFYVARPNGRGFTRPDSSGENVHNNGDKKDQPGDQKFNRKVPSGYDTKIGPHTGSDAAQVAEDFQPPDADYWEEIMPQFDLDGAIAEGDILVEEIACNMIEPDLIDDRDQGLEHCHQIYDGTNLNMLGCCRNVDSL